MCEEDSWLPAVNQGGRIYTREIGQQGKLRLSSSWGASLQAFSGTEVNMGKPSPVGGGCSGIVAGPGGF